VTTSRPADPSVAPPRSAPPTGARDEDDRPAGARGEDDRDDVPTASEAPGEVASGAARPTLTTPRRVMGYRRQRFEARKVRRLIRHVDPWSMLKLAVLVSLCMWLIVMIAAVVMWTVARNAGTIANIENFVNSSLSLQDWKLDGEFIFRQFGLVTLLLALGFAASIVVASLVFNLISDIIGGVWVSVIEEETARPVAEPNGAAAPKRPATGRVSTRPAGSRAGSKQDGMVG
jgi:hypothetical protein